MNTLDTILGAMRGYVRLRRKFSGPLRPTWNEDFEAFATFLRLYGRRSHWLPLGLQRIATDSIPPKTAAIRRTESTACNAGGVRAEWFQRDNSDPDRVLLYLHGGGYCIGSVDSHRDLLARLCGVTGGRVLAPNYRLAPEHPFPAQLLDAMTTYRWLLEFGIRPSNIVIAGESAGGALTLSTLIALRNHGEPMPAAGICLSPWADMDMSGGSIQSNAGYDYLGLGTMRRFSRYFLGTSSSKNPLASPIHADLSGLPPLLIHAGGAEVLLDDALRLATRARAAGVAVELEVWADMNHAFHVFSELTPESDEALQRVGDFVKRIVPGNQNEQQLQVLEGGRQQRARGA